VKRARSLAARPFGWVIAALLAAAWPLQPALGFHFPWDQGHDTFDPDDPDDPNPPDDDGDDDGDPVELLEGNFRYERTRHDIRVLDDGPVLELLFTYHSRDLHNGLFGHGWHSTLTSLAVKVTDGEVRHVIIRRGDGRRKRYLLNDDGTFDAPTGVYDRLLENQDGSYTLLFKGGLAHQYNAAGQLTGIEDAGGRAIAVTYDALGAIESATSAGGRTLTFVKGPNGKIATVMDTLAGDYQFEYDAEGDLVRVTDPLGNVTTYEYEYDQNGNPLHNLVAVFAPSGARELLNEYDDSDRLIAQTLLEGAQAPTIEFDYESANSARVTDPIRGTVAHQFDNFGRPTTTTAPDGTTTRVWDANLNLQSVTQDGGTTTFEYDERGNITRIVEPDGNVTTFTYEPAHDRLATVANQSTGTTAEVSYDDAQDTVQIRDVAGVVSEFPAHTYGLVGAEPKALGPVFPFAARYPLRP
jgi:YD repeat-containing protein